MREKGIALCRERFILDIRKILHKKGGQALEEAAQGSCGITIPGGT